MIAPLQRLRPLAPAGVALSVTGVLLGLGSGSYFAISGSLLATALCLVAATAPRPDGPANAEPEG